jgi:hypothetical protein
MPGDDSQALVRNGNWLNTGTEFFNPKVRRDTFCRENLWPKQIRTDTRTNAVIGERGGLTENMLPRACKLSRQEDYDEWPIRETDLKNDDRGSVCASGNKAERKDVDGKRECPWRTRSLAAEVGTGAASGGQLAK